MADAGIGEGFSKKNKNAESVVPATGDNDVDFWQKGSKIQEVGSEESPLRHRKRGP